MCIRCTKPFAGVCIMPSPKDCVFRERRVVCCYVWIKIERACKSLNLNLEALSDGCYQVWWRCPIVLHLQVIIFCLSAVPVPCHQACNCLGKGVPICREHASAAVQVCLIKNKQPVLCDCACCFATWPIDSKKRQGGCCALNVRVILQTLGSSWRPWVGSNHVAPWRHNV